MNYLAHVMLAHGQPKLQIGQLLGDFVKPRRDGLFSAPVQAGIQAHRRVDSFVDQHPAFCAAKRLISHSRRRFSGIMVDVFADHYLIRHWQEYMSQPLSCFTKDFYEHLRAFAKTCPADLQLRLDRVVDYDLLMACRTESGIDRVLARIDSRLSRPTTLVGGATELFSQLDQFDEHFHVLFEVLMTEHCFQSQ